MALTSWLLLPVWSTQNLKEEVVGGRRVEGWGWLVVGVESEVVVVVVG